MVSFQVLVASALKLLATLLVLLTSPYYALTNLVGGNQNSDQRVDSGSESEPDSTCEKSDSEPDSTDSENDSTDSETDSSCNEPDSEPDATSKEPDLEPDTTCKEPDSQPDSTCKEPDSQPDSTSDATCKKSVSEPDTTSKKPDLEPDTSCEKPDSEPDLTYKKPDSEPDTISNKPDLEPDSTSKKRDVEPDTTSKNRDVEPDTTSKNRDVEPDTTSKTRDLEPDTTSKKRDVEPNTTSKKRDVEADTRSNKPDSEPDTSSKNPDSKNDSTSKKSDSEPDSTSKKRDVEPESTSKNRDVEPDTTSNNCDLEPDTRSNKPDSELDTTSKNLDSENDSTRKKPDREPDSTSNKPDSEPDTTSNKPDSEPDSTSKKPDLEPDSTSNKPDSEPDSTSKKPDLEPDSLSKKPDSEPDSTSNKPDSEPDSTSKKPDLEPDSTSNKPDSEPDSTSKKPDIEPDATSKKPDLEPDSTSNKPDSEPDSTSKKPDLEPDPTSKKPDSQPDSTSKKPDLEPDPTSKKPDSQPDSTSNKPDLEPDSKSKKPDLEPDPTSKKPDLESQLYLAIQDSATDKVAELLQHQGINVNCINVKKETPLHIAVKKNSRDIVEFLLGHHGINVNCINKNKETPLHIAVEKNSRDIVDVLLGHHGIDVNCINKKTPLHIAIDHNYEHIDKNNNRYIQENSKRYILDVLLGHCEINVNIQDSPNKETPLHILFRRGRKISYDKEYLKKITEEFLAKSIDVNLQDIHGKTALFYIRENNDMLEYLLDKKMFDVCIQDEQEKTILHYYCIQKNAKLDIVKKMIDCCDKKILYLKDNGGELPYTYAKFKEIKETAILELLETKEIHVLQTIKKKSLPEIKKLVESIESWMNFFCIKTNKSVLHFGLEEVCNVEKTKFLLSQAKEHINHCDNDCMTPLHLAIKCDCLSNIVHLLLEADADINAASNAEKKTPVHYALELGREDILQMLFKNQNFKFSMLDGEGMNYLHYLCLHAPIIADSSILECICDVLHQNFKIVDEVDAGTNAEKSPQIAVEIDTKNCIPLFYAIQKGCPKDFLKLLLKTFYKANDITNFLCSDKEKSVLMQAFNGNDSFCGSTLNCLLEFLKEENYIFGCNEIISDREGKNVFHYAFECDIPKKSRNSKEIPEDYKDMLKNLIHLFDKEALEKHMYAKEDLTRKSPLELLWNSCKNKNDTDIIFYVAGRLGCEMTTIGNLGHQARHELNILMQGAATENFLDCLTSNDDVNHFEAERALKPRFILVGRMLRKMMETEKGYLTVKDLRGVVISLSTKRNDIIVEVLNEFDNDSLKTEELNIKQREKLDHYLGRSYRDLGIGARFIYEAFAKKFNLDSGKDFVKAIEQEIKQDSNHTLFDWLDTRFPHFKLEEFYKIMLDCRFNNVTYKLFDIVFKLSKYKAR